MPTTLAIETSCDDTSVALVQEHQGYFSVVDMYTYSQTQLHDTYGGVVPELAYRSHAQKILPCVQELAERVGGLDALQEMIDTISVTSRPGLPGALLVGINAAHTLGRLWQKPVCEVHHIMGHVFSILLERQLAVSHTPYVCLTVSGGHTDIYLIETHDTIQEKQDIHNEYDWIKRQHLGIGEEVDVGPFHVTKLGQTRDDAAGEVFDKVARMLGGPYPGGAWLSELASHGGPDPTISFRQSKLEDDSFDFSFSGLKSQVYNLLRRYKQDGVVLDKQTKENIAYAFQQVITEMLTKKLIAASVKYQARVVGVVGGVAANTILREKVQAALEAMHETSTLLIASHVPSKHVYCTDNAAMIGVAGLVSMIEA